ncbi:MAG: DUF885 family protein [Planctomycetota bacterium]
MLCIPLLLLAAQADASPTTPPTSAEGSTLLADASTVELIQQYRADRDALGRLWSFPLSSAGSKRKLQLAETWMEHLDALDYQALDHRSRIDWHLLRNQVDYDRRQIALNRNRDANLAPYVSFAPPLVRLLEDRVARLPVQGEWCAQILHNATDVMLEQRKALANAEQEVLPTLANRAAGKVEALQRSLRNWFQDHDGYDPLFGWWCRQPWKALDQEITAYAEFLREDLGGIDPEEEDRLLGNPIGREALLQALAYERIAYTPEELIAIGERELEWCMEQRRRAAQELGLGDDWKAAQEAVKEIHALPGGQAEMISMLADEAVAFLKERDLVTIPALAEEVWRMDMMSLQRQKYTPYFTGGEVISIAYPMEEMEHGDKRMAMRGNNEPYSRATVHHELIPGHHLQGYMSQRWNPHRRFFYTPFLVEGWALYWELRLWDLDFHRTPEDRIGMLFWRSHRCARILFSLRYHLGDWTAEECVDFLVEQVGHERRNATAEVRRSIQGGYGPLYQCAYMLGGLQLRALHREMVIEGGWQERDFHDAILHAGPIPNEFLRAEMRGLEVPKDFPVGWRFDD